MKRLIVTGMMLMLLLGCATTKAIDKAAKSEPITTEEKTDVGFEWLESILNWILDPFNIWR